ncbi:hypothetical protein Ciccas_003458 [Cichlidogyrus casuarinus]|uniref:C2 domain-containing protein n=1 Tax=Cichlidogyrus casuarinus TaxID=1844966 RepID=A0ABD2QEA9_9PLAT
MSDPYCRVVFGYCSEKTIQLDSTLCPTWDETIIFPPIELCGNVEYMMQNPPSVVMEFFDFNKITSDQYLGRCEATPSVQIDPDDKPKIRLNWFDIYRHGRKAGQVLAAFEMILMEKVDLPMPPPRLADRYMVPHGIRPEMQLTRVEILCWGVRNMKKYQLCSVNNPCVEFDVGEKFVHSDVLKNAKYNSNFEHNKLTIDVMLPIMPRFMPPLNIRVNDHRLFGRKPVVGLCSLSDLASFRCQPLAADLDPLLAFPTFAGDSKLLTDANQDQSSSAIVNLNETQDKIKDMQQKKNMVSFQKCQTDLLSDWFLFIFAGIKSWFVRMKSKMHHKKKLPTLDLTQLDEDIDWWSKFYASLGEYGKCRKYMDLGYDKLKYFDTELEKVENFDKFQDLCNTYKLTRGKNMDEEDDNFAGEFKGTFFVYPISDDISAPKPLRYLDQLVPDMKKLDCIVRVYVIRACDLQPNDPSGLADPYILVRCGHEKKKSSHVPNNLNPEFGCMFQFKAVIPRDKDLKVQIWDYDLLTTDDMIGKS